MSLDTLTLAGLGIYGVIAVATAQRTREIGLRIAMGARPRHVVWMVVPDVIGLAAGGVAVGLLASLLFSQTLTSLLYEVTPFDSTTLAAVAVLLLAVAGRPRCLRLVARAASIHSSPCGPSEATRSAET